MPKLKSSTAAANALVGIWTVSLTAFIIATLYLARSLLIPLALAALLTFLLAPLVTRLERWLGRIGAVLLWIYLIGCVFIFGACLCAGQAEALGQRARRRR
jgi:predicted PurR-regulated permease PerM